MPSATLAIAEIGSMLLGAVATQICSAAEGKGEKRRAEPAGAAYGRQGLPGQGRVERLPAPEVQLLHQSAGDDADRSAGHWALEMLGSSTDEAILLLDLGRVAQQLHLWKSCLPRVRPHYAVKCNPEPALLEELRAGGCGFDCATKAEIDLALSIGVAAEEIVFSHPCKLRSHLRQAASRGVRLMSFDNTVELLKISAECPQARLLLRLVCDDSGALCPMSSKFGAGHEIWPGLLDLCVALKLDFAGVSFHVGSGCKNPASFEKALSDAKEVFLLAMERGLAPSVLDIGGGYPCCDSSAYDEFRRIATVISDQLEYHFPSSGHPDLRIIAEPGRFFAASAGTLLTKVFAKSCHPSQNLYDGPCFRYYLNDGLYGSFNCVLYDHAEVVPELLYDGPSRHDAASSAPLRCSIFGPTCDGFDVILGDHRMVELQEGDWLLWRNMGAYTSAAGSDFNGFPKAIVWPYRHMEA